MKRESTVDLLPNRTGKLFGNDKVVLQKFLYYDRRRTKEEKRYEWFGYSSHFPLGEGRDCLDIT